MCNVTTAGRYCFGYDRCGCLSVCLSLRWSIHHLLLFLTLISVCHGLHAQIVLNCLLVVNVVFTAAENCVKVEIEEIIKLSNDYNPCDGTNNKVSVSQSQTQNEFPRTSEMTQSCHVKKILTSDNLEPNRHDTVNALQNWTQKWLLKLNIKSQPQDEFSRISKMAQSFPVKKIVTSDSVEPNRCATVANKHHFIGPSTSQGSYGRPSTSQDSYGTEMRENTICEIPQVNSYSVEPNTHAVAINIHHYSANTELSGIGSRENMVDEVPQLTNDTAEPNKQSIVVNRHQFGGRGPSQGSSGTVVRGSTHDRRRQCEVCGMKFAFPRSLVYHVRIHTGEKPYNCSFCDKKFRMKHAQKMHELWHKGELPQCPVCGGRYVELRRHMLTHDDSANYKHVCSVCKKRFRVVQQLQKHVLIHSDERPYTCQDCGRRFRTKSHLKVHMASHIREKNHGCTVCGKMFSQKGAVKSHMRTHSDERPYSCETCGKAFKQRQALETHQTVHTSEKRCTCDTCGKQFPRYISLQRHSLIHSGVQPYECSVCGMKFNQSSSMRRHMLIHTGEKPYSCSDCGERFRQSSCLASHRRRHCSKNKQK